jgi:hypothetical protein
MHLPTVPTTFSGGIFMAKKNADDQYSDEETERRATEALRRSLTTPPKPQKEMVGKVSRPNAKRKRSVKSAPKTR